MIVIKPQQGKLNDHYQLIVSDPKISYKEALASFQQNPLILFIEGKENNKEYVFTFEPLVSGPLVLSVNGETAKIDVAEQKAASIAPMKPLSFEAKIPFELSQENEIVLNEIMASQPQYNVDLITSKTFPWIPLFSLALIGTLLPLLILYLKGKKKILPPKEAAIETLKAMQTKPYNTPQDLYEDLTAVVREYLERTYRLPITKLTTEEFFKVAPTLPNLNQATIDFFLKEADKVKFARKTPSPKEINAAVQAAKQIIR